MNFSQGFSSQGEYKDCRLLKSYGLKQASRQQNVKLSQALSSSGFKQRKRDYFLFTRNVDNTFVLILVYVDDLKEIKNAQKSLHQHFKIKELGEVRYFLGIEFARAKEGILMTQRKYVLEMISDAGLASSKPKETTMEQNLKLISTEFDTFTDTSKGDESLEDSGNY